MVFVNVVFVPECMGVGTVPHKHLFTFVFCAVRSLAFAPFVRCDNMPHIKNHLPLAFFIALFYYCIFIITFFTTMTNYAYAPTTSLGSPKKNSIRLVTKDEWIERLSSMPKNTKFFASIDGVLTETKSLKAEQMPCNELPGNFWTSNLAPDYMPVNVIRKFKK